MDQDIQNLLASFNQLGASLRSNSGSVGQSMARLRVELQRGTGTVQSNAAALQRLISDFENLDEVTRKSQVGVNMLNEQTRMASQIMRDSVGQLSAGLAKGGLAEAVDYVAKQLFTTIGNYQDGATGMQAAFNNQNAAIESQIRVLERLQSGATMTAEALMLIPNPMARFGAMVAAGAAGLAAFAKEATEKQKQAFQIFQKEMTITSQSFDVMQKSGVLFQSGFADVRATAGSLQLNMDELAKTVAQNKMELTNFGGSVTGGVRKLKMVGDAFTRLSTQGRDLRKELEYAGYSQQEQTEGMVDYMDMLNRTGRLRGMSDEQIATQGTEYLKVQKAITAFTGEEAKAAQKRAQEASEQLAVQAKLRKSQDPQAMEKFQTLVKTMPADMTKGLQQMVATGGTVVDKNLNILFSQSPTRKKMLDEAYADLNSGLYKQEELAARQEERMKKYGPALEQEALAMGDSFGLVNSITGGYAEVTGMAQNQVKESQKGQASLVDQLGTTTEQMRKFTQEGIDPLRDATINAARAMRQDLPDVIKTMGKTVNDYIQSSFGKEGVQGMAEAVRKANAANITLINEVLGKVAASRDSKPFMQPGTAVADTINKGVEYLLDATKKLSSAAGNLLNATKNLPGRNKGTPGSTGKLLEDFGKEQLLIAHGRQGMYTEKQLMNLINGVSVTSGQDAVAKSTNSIALGLEKLQATLPTEPVTEINVSPTMQATNLDVGNQLKDSFTQSMAAFQQQKLQAETAKPIADETESTKIVEAIQEAFSGQNGFNQMLSSLKGQLETDSNQQISVLREQVTKLEDLLSAMQDTATNTERMARELA